MLYCIRLHWIEANIVPPGCSIINRFSVPFLRQYNSIQTHDYYVKPINVIKVEGSLHTQKYTQFHLRRWHQQQKKLVTKNTISRGFTCITMLRFHVISSTAGSAVWFRGMDVPMAPTSIQALRGLTQSALANMHLMTSESWCLSVQMLWTVMHWEWRNGIYM